MAETKDANNDLCEIVHGYLQDNGYIVLSSDKNEFDTILLGYRTGWKGAVRDSRYILVFVSSNSIGWHRLELTDMSQEFSSIHEPDSLDSLLKELA